MEVPSLGRRRGVVEGEVGGVGRPDRAGVTVGLPRRPHAVVHTDYGRSRAADGPPLTVSRPASPGGVCGGSTCPDIKRFVNIDVTTHLLKKKKFYIERLKLLYFYLNKG